MFRVQTRKTSMCIRVVSENFIQEMRLKLDSAIGKNWITWKRGGVEDMVITLVYFSSYFNMHSRPALSITVATSHVCLFKFKLLKLKIQFISRNDHIVRTPEQHLASGHSWKACMVESSAKQPHFRHIVSSGCGEKEACCC